MPRAKGLPRSLPTSRHPRFCGLSWCAAARLVEAAAEVSSYAGLRLGMRSPTSKSSSDGSPTSRPSPSYELGALASWRRLATCGDPAQLREALASSPWGDPGGDGQYATSA
jgi:hypothetical protein